MCMRVRGVKEGADQHPQYDNDMVRRVVAQILARSSGPRTDTLGR